MGWVSCGAGSGKRGSFPSPESLPVSRNFIARRAPSAGMCRACAWGGADGWRRPLGGHLGYVCGECERPVPFSSRCPGPQRCACQELHRAQHSQHRLQRHLRGRQGRAEVNSRGVGVGAGVEGRPCTGSECSELGARTHPFSGSSLARRWQRSCVQAEGWGEQGFLGFSL